VLAFATFVALVLNCVGTGYWVITAKIVNQGFYISLWNIYNCVFGFCGPRTDFINYAGCDEIRRPFRAAEAFVVMADVFLGFAFIFALLEYFAVVPRVIGVVLAIIFILFDIVAWAIVVAVYNRQTCGTTLAFAHDLAAGFDLLVAATVLVFLAIIFWFIRFCCWSGDCCTNRYTAQPVQFMAPVAPAVMVQPGPVTYSPALSPAVSVAPPPMMYAPSQVVRTY